MPQPFSGESLLGSWRHAHEEDVGSRRVFRVEDYPFPPSRGRRGYEFRRDGTLVVRAPGPVDRAVTLSGRWSLSPEGLLELHLPSGRTERYRVVALDEGRLVVDGG